VDLYFREIRVVTATYTTTAVDTQDAQEPSATPVQNTGLKQGQSTTATPESLDIQGAP
jgi:hypothetical protein